MSVRHGEVDNKSSRSAVRVVEESHRSDVDAACVIFAGERRGEERDVPELFKGANSPVVSSGSGESANTGDGKE